MLQKNTPTVEFTLDHPYLCQLLDKECLNKPGSSKHTFFIRLKIDPAVFSYEAGDSIGVIAPNPPPLVEQLTEVFKPYLEKEIFYEKKQLSFSVYTLLQKLDFQKLNKKILAFLLPYFKTNKEIDYSHLLDPTQKTKLIEFCQKYHFIDLLPFLEIASIPLESFFNLFSFLLPRFYSIASCSTQYPNEIHLVIAELKYELNKQARVGIASHFLCHTSMPLNHQIPIYLLKAPHFKLPSDTQTPVIMVGPGTGVAPFRAFMQQRAKAQAHENYLFFGERQAKYDFYFQNEWENYEKKGLLTLFTAFSRDQSYKLYVQDRVKQQSEMIFSLLDQKGAYFYLCGDAKKMAKDVEASLLQLIQEHGQKTPKEALQYLKDLRKAGRYLKDVY